MIRALLPLVRMLDRGQVAEVRAILMGWVRSRPKIPKDATIVAPYPTQIITDDIEPIFAVPKPAKRITNPRALTAYKKQLGRCEVKGRDCWGPLDFSHIMKRSKGGPDVDEAGNVQGLVLCRYHHEIWERSPWSWWVRYGPRLTAEARAKVLRWRPTLQDGPLHRASS